MKAETKETEIGGVKLTTTKLAPTRGYVLSPKLLRVVAPILAAGGKLQDIAVNDLAEGLLRYSDDERMQLMLSVFASTTVRADEFIELTSEAAINRAFPDMFVLFRALWWVIGFNFFPSGVAVLVAAAQAKANPST